MSGSSLGFEHDVITWCIIGGFVVVVLIIILVALGVAENNIHNPLGPFIQWIDSRQRHRQRMRERQQEAELTLRHDLELTKARRDNPDYTAFLERQSDEARRNL
jgi:hypothetical protein